MADVVDFKARREERRRRRAEELERNELAQLTEDEWRDWAYERMPREDRRLVGHAGWLVAKAVRELKAEHGLGWRGPPGGGQAS